MKNSSVFLCLIGLALTVAAISHVVLNASGIVRVLAIIGSVLIAAVPTLLFGIAQEVYRAAWQGWRIATWLASDESYDIAKQRGYSPKKRSRLRLFFPCFLGDFGSSYTVKTVNHKDFYYEPSEEEAYFKKEEERWA